ncbi:DUF697 domain-containing protein [Acholeplasma equirhinis]|uniref:DUF697 domain-containing protein n=1 Tax=Acholeplasma equirhinis TaxID=555393 RepID=UPI00197AE5AA|nr:DUF697 domain-containing protein [Acholeplasma equirhinis]MBN3490655.1 DUF697 domain-containing protein [Acholeplasma equirhinis]
MKKDSSVKLWYLACVGAIILIIMMVTASVLQIGNQLATIHPYVSYGFYVLAVLLTYFLLVRPIVIILWSPSFSIDTTLDKNPKKTYSVFKVVAKRLLDNNDLTQAEKEEIKNAMGDAHKLRDALNHAYNHHIKKKMNAKIREHAKTVMISTAISQNGRLDFITVIVVNVRMIKDLVVMCGFRPSYRNLAKLVVNVFTTALIAEGLENIKIQDVLPQSTMNMLGEIPLIKPVMSSVVEGISNALLTLRIGIVTRKYLFDDAEDLTKEKIRFGALLEAAKHLPMVIADGLMIFPNAVFNMFKPKAKKLEDLDEAK